MKGVSGSLSRIALRESGQGTPSYVTVVQQYLFQNCQFCTQGLIDIKCVFQSNKNSFGSRTYLKNINEMKKEMKRNEMYVKICLTQSKTYNIPLSRGQSIRIDIKILLTGPF